MAVAGGHSHRVRRLLAFLAGAGAAGALTYGTAGAAGWALRLPDLSAGLPLIAASGLFLAAWHGGVLGRRGTAEGRQISKRLARARRIGPLAYGAVLGTGVLTIISTPAVWLGMLCCLAMGSPAWGAAYGLSFGAGRTTMLGYDTGRSRGLTPGGVTFLVLERQLGPARRYRWCAVAGGLVLLALAAGSAAVTAG